MIEFDSHSTKPSSLMTGTIALGLSARNSAVSVDRKPDPQSSCSNGRFSSAQVQSTLRTLIELTLPRICSMGDPVNDEFGHSKRPECALTGTVEEMPRWRTQRTGAP